MTKGDASAGGISDVKAVAFYLPQFHPVPENDSWWGPGFTEWTNVAKARPLFPGHYQPRLPGELGFYDLRVSETRKAQADLAREYGISAFCYWHYWFGGGRTILERPFREVLASGEPDFPFCLGWANQSWSGIWHGASDRLLIEQSYPGVDDVRTHFETLLPAFHDRRYFRVDDKPVFYIFDPVALPNAQQFLDLWRVWAAEAGLQGMFFVGQTWGDGRSSLADFDAFVRDLVPAREISSRDWPRRFARRLGVPPIRSYGRFAASSALGTIDAPSCPMVVPGWDNTPRSGAGGVVLHGASPALFESHVRRAVHHLENRPSSARLLFVKSWNEWAEGSYLEPDRRFGRAYLEAMRRGLGSVTTDRAYAERRQ